jgi:hypothetical protein
VQGRSELQGVWPRGLLSRKRWRGVAPPYPVPAAITAGTRRELFGSAAPAQAPVLTRALPGSLGAPPNSAMNFSVLSRAIESGTCTGGDFIR